MQFLVRVAELLAERAVLKAEPGGEHGNTKQTHEQSQPERGQQPPENAEARRLPGEEFENDRILVNGQGGQKEKNDGQQYPEDSR